MYSSQCIKTKVVLSISVLLFTISIFYSLSSKGQALELYMDNDFFVWYNQTDRYYTYGLTGIYYHPKSEDNKHVIKKIFPEAQNLIAHYSLNIKGFTPGNIEETDNNQDFYRPFAGWLFGQYGVIAQLNQYHINTGFNVGVMGPAAKAGRFQNWFHEQIGDEFVEGWENQIVNQLGITWYIDLRKSLIKNNWSEIIFEPDVYLGSILTHVTGKARLRIGRFNNINNSILYRMNIGKQHKTEYFVSLRGE